MNSFLADTMAIVLFLENRKLPHSVKEIFNSAVKRDQKLGISIISLMEIGYLSEKRRIDISMDAILKLADQNDHFFIHNLTPEIVIEAFKITSIPELHDRLITAAAFNLKIPLITNDPLIIKSQVV